MDSIVRVIYYSSMLLYFVGLILLFVQKGKDIKRSLYYTFLVALIIQSVCLLLLFFIKYVTTQYWISLDLLSLDCLFRSFGLGIVLVFASKKYNHVLLSKTIIIAILLLFVSTFPMPLVSEIKICDFLAEGIALPVSLLIYDFSIVIFAYCFSLSVTFLFQKPESDDDHTPNSSESIYNRIYNCAIWGLSIFTLSHIVGSIGVLTQHGTYWFWNPMHLFFISIWMLYAGMIHVKWINNLSGKALPTLGIIGFSGLIGFRVIIAI